MLSLIPLLIHDTDLPAQVRVELQRVEHAGSSAVRAQAQRAAAATLQAAYGLDCAEVKDLLAPHGEHLRCAA